MHQHKGQWWGSSLHDVQNHDQHKGCEVAGTEPVYMFFSHCFCCWCLHLGAKNCWGHRCLHLCPKISCTQRSWTSPARDTPYPADPLGRLEYGCRYTMLCYFSPFFFSIITSSSSPSIRSIIALKTGASLSTSCNCTSRASNSLCLLFFPIFSYCLPL